MAIEWKGVFSDRVQEMGYDAETKTMAVRFRGGKVYHYKGVPEEVFDDVSNSWSVGIALNEKVIGKYGYEKE